jgi:hypothetical protein
MVSLLELVDCLAPRDDGKRFHRKEVGRPGRRLTRNNASIEMRRVDQRNAALSVNGVNIPTLQKCQNEPSCKKA